MLVLLRIGAEMEPGARPEDENRPPPPARSHSYCDRITYAVREASGRLGTAYVRKNEPH